MKPRTGRHKWLLALLREAQAISEKLLLVGLAIRIRKSLEKRLRSDPACIDTEVHGAVGSRTRGQEPCRNLSVVKRPWLTAEALRAWRTERRKNAL